MTRAGRSDGSGAAAGTTATAGMLPLALPQGGAGGVIGDVSSGQPTLPAVASSPGGAAPIQGFWSPRRGAPMRPAIGPHGVWLRAHRLGRRLTQVELAERAGVSKEAIHTIERGRKHPHRSTLLLLGRAMNAVPPPPASLV